VVALAHKGLLRHKKIYLMVYVFMLLSRDSFVSYGQRRKAL